MIKVGDEQTLVYSSLADLEHGLFYLSPEKREELRNDIVVPLHADHVCEKLKTKKSSLMT